MQDLFDDAQDLGDNVVLVQTFKKILLSACGSKSKTLKASLSHTPNEEVQPLTLEDVDMLSERFEIGGRIHYGHFLQYFREIAAPTLKSGKGTGRSYTAADGSLQVPSGRPIPTVGISPFRMSSEWAALKAEAVRNYSEEREQYSNEMSAIDSRLLLLNSESDSKYTGDKSSKVDFTDRNMKSGKGNKEDKSDRMDSSRHAVEDSRKLPPVMPSAANKADSKNNKPALPDGKDSSFNDSKISKNDNKDNKVDKMETKSEKNDRSASGAPKSPPPKPIRSHLGQYEGVLSDLKREEEKENRENGVPQNGVNQNGVNGQNDVKNGNNNGNSSGSPNSQNRSDFGTELDTPKKTGGYFFNKSPSSSSSPPKANESTSFFNNNRFGGNKHNGKRDDLNNTADGDKGDNTSANDLGKKNGRGDDQSTSQDVSVPARRSWIPSFGFGRKSAPPPQEGGGNNGNNGENGDEGDRGYSKAMGRSRDGNIDTVRNSYDNNRNNNNNNSTNYSSKDMDLGASVSSLKQPQPAQSPKGMGRFLPWGKSSKSAQYDPSQNSQSNGNDRNTGANNNDDSFDGNKNQNYNNNSNSSNNNNDNYSYNNGNHSSNDRRGSLNSSSSGRRNSLSNNEHVAL